MNLTKLTKPRAKWITFKLKVAKAVSRSLYDKLIDQGFSVKDFGAKGDGRSDDTEAFKAAASSNLGFILVPFTQDSYVINEVIQGDFYGFGALSKSGSGSLPSYINLLPKEV